MFKNSPLLVKEHNRKACKYWSAVKFSLTTKLICQQGKGTKRNLTFTEAFVPWEVNPNQNILGTLSEGQRLKEISDFPQFTGLTQIRFRVIKLQPKTDIYKPFCHILSSAL